MGLLGIRSAGLHSCTQLFLRENMSFKLFNDFVGVEEQSFTVFYFQKMNCKMVWLQLSCSMCKVVLVIVVWRSPMRVAKNLDCVDLSKRETH